MGWPLSRSKVSGCVYRSAQHIHQYTRLFNRFYHQVLQCTSVMYTPNHDLRCRATGAQVHDAVQCNIEFIYTYLLQGQSSKHVCGSGVCYPADQGPTGGQTALFTGMYGLCTHKHGVERWGRDRGRRTACCNHRGKFWRPRGRRGKITPFLSFEALVGTSMFLNQKEKNCPRKDVLQ